MIFSKFSVLVSLLATLTVAIPSPAEENKDTARNGAYIQNLNIVINCYFNSDSPDCKNEKADASDARESKSSEEEAEDKGNDKNEKGMPVSKKSTGDDLDLPESLYSNEVSRYGEMERFRYYWPHRINSRNRLCLFCFAIISEPDILNEPFRAEARERLERLDDRAFNAVHYLFEETKTSLGINLDEPVPLEQDHGFCSSIVQQYTYKRANVERKNAKEEVKRGEEKQEDKLEFYTRLMINLEDDPTYLQCEDVNEDKLAQTKAEFRSILEGRRME